MTAGPSLTVLLPYTDEKLDPRCVELLQRHVCTVRRYAGSFKAVRLDPRDTSAYFRLVESEWSQPGDLVIVEHDIGIHRHVMPAFLACREPWCGNAYAIGEQMLVCLGCTRFTAELKAAEPDLLNEVGQVGNDGLQARDWRRLDVRLADALHKRGYQHHEHTPPVTHYHEYQ